MSINTEINRLLNFAKQNMLINEDDYYYAANRLLDVLKVDAFEPEFVDEKLPTAMPISVFSALHSSAQKTATKRRNTVEYTFRSVSDSTPLSGIL